MIYVDPSEVREETRLYLGDLKFIIVPGLEELTGADMMISALNAPCSSEQLIRFHLKNKAILVQRKHRMDLVSSLGDRLKSSISKMRTVTFRPAQRVLLFIGVLTCDRDGNAVIDGQETKRPFWSVYAGLSTWIKYGGVVEPPLCRSTLLPEWVQMKERHIREAIDMPIKEVILSPDPVYEVEADDPVQELVLVKDWRQTAMCCPGWGIKRINQLRQYMLEHNSPDTLMAAIFYMTTSEGLDIPGVGKSMIEKARKWSGVLDRAPLDVNIKDVEIKYGKD